jgi:hypothetical protein
MGTGLTGLQVLQWVLRVLAGSLNHVGFNLLLPMQIYLVHCLSIILLHSCCELCMASPLAPTQSCALPYTLPLLCAPSVLMPLDCVWEGAEGAAQMEGAGGEEPERVGREGNHADPPAPLASMSRGHRGNGAACREVGGGSGGRGMCASLACVWETARMLQLRMWT